MTIKSLFLVDHLRENGGLRVAHELARRLQTTTAGAEFFVLQAVSDGPVLAVDPSIPVIVGNQARRKFRWAIPVGAVRLLRQARRFDVLLSVSETGYTLLVGWVVSRLVHRPFVVFVQSPLADSIATWVPRRIQKFTRWVNAHADAAICVSPRLVQDVVDNGLPVAATFAVTVGLDIDKIRRLAQEQSTVPVPVGRYLVAVGRLSGQKGFDLLIRAHAAVMAMGESHLLYILGEGPERARLEQLATELGVRDSVKVVGFVANPHPLLARADLFVLSSRLEGMGGLVLVEALGHGVPIVATDCVAGPRSLLDDGRLGELVPSEDADALAAAIHRHLADPAELRSRAEAGPDRAREFDPAAAAAQFAQVLRSVTTRQAPRPPSLLRRRLDRRVACPRHLPADSGGAPTVPTPLRPQLRR